jgi:carbon storage regulator CsrA
MAGANRCGGSTGRAVTARDRQPWKRAVLANRRLAARLRPQHGPGQGDHCMLVLSRRLNEKLCFPGMRTVVQVVGVKGGVVRLGVEAPPEVTVLREECEDRTAAEYLSRPAGGPGDGEARGRTFEQVQEVACAELDLALFQLEAGRYRDVQMLLDKIQEDVAWLAQRQRPDRQEAVLAAPGEPRQGTS